MRISPRHLLAALAFLASTAINPPSFAQQVDTQTLLATAIKTQQRIATDGAAWTKIIDFHATAPIRVDQIVLGARASTTLTINIGGQNHLLAKIIQTNGNWYVTQSTGQREKYRPNEAVFTQPQLYPFITFSGIQFANQAALQADLSPGADGKLTEHVPLDPAARKQLEDVLKGIQNLIDTNPGKPIPPQITKTMADDHDMLDHGMAVEMDPATGILTRVANPRMILTTENFRFPTAADAKALDVNDTAYTDKTGPISADMNNVAMFWNMPGWQPGVDSGDMDLTLLDLSTGDTRRVPFQDAEATVGCFSPDRQSIFTTGSTVGTGEGTLRLVEINLKTGENRLFPGKLTSTGINMNPILSRDGKLLCVGHVQVGIPPKMQALLVDLATGEEHAIGDAGDFTLAGWAEGNQIVLNHHDDPKPGDADRIVGAIVSIMDMQGKERPLVRGRFPAIIGDGKTILFQDEQQNWKTCDLEGKNVHPFNPAIDKKYNFPTSSPDGKRVLMIHYPGGKEYPQPVIISLADGSITPVKVPQGLWTTPAWR